MKVDALRTMVDFNKPYTKNAAEIQSIQESMRVTNNPQTISELMESEVKSRLGTANLGYSATAQLSGLVKSSASLNISG